MKYITILLLFLYSCEPPKHSCHQDRYNRHPHDVKQSNFKHDLSRY